MRSDTLTRQLIFAEAERRGWQVVHFDPKYEYYLIKTDTGKTCLFRGCQPQTSSSLGVQVAINKLLSYTLAQYFDVTVAPFQRYTNESTAVAFLQQHGPLVIKPLRGTQGQAVTTNVRYIKELRQAVSAAQNPHGVLLQQQLTGQDYRLLVIGGQFFAAAYRKPAFVVGDGKRAIRELIEQKNQHPWRGSGHQTPLTRIDLVAAEAFCGDLERVPKANEEVQLAAVANISHGGEAGDVTERVHDSYRVFAEMMSQKLQLTVCGLDIMTPNISHAPTKFMPLLEINAMPALGMHHFPLLCGKSRDAAARVLDVALT